MKNIFSLLFLMGCAAELETTGHEKELSEPLPPPEFGVNAAEDCDQAEIGSSVCNLVLYDQNEEIWQLYDHAGKVIIIDISTVWCYPCQVAGHHAQPIQDEYGDNIVFVTILVEGATGDPTTQNDIKDWVDDHAVTTAPVLQGNRDYVIDPAGLTGYLVGGFPTYIYIDQDLKIHTGHVGFNEEHVRLTLDGLL
jgi:thiol-disulfide isomerase/thioredoxin